MKFNLASYCSWTPQTITPMDVTVHYTAQGETINETKSIIFIKNLHKIQFSLL